MKNVEHYLKLFSEIKDSNVKMERQDLAETSKKSGGTTVKEKEEEEEPLPIFGKG